MVQYRAVASIADFPEGGGKVVRVGDRQILIMNVGGELYALDQFCAHRAAPLVKGEIVEGQLLCPWHGNTFDVATGSCLANPDEKVSTYPVDVRGEEVWVGID
ncbi:MAG: Rieske (2Fe-2S) protein [Nitrospiria bacterium]